MSTESRALKVGASPVTYFNSPFRGLPVETTVRITAVDRDRTHGHSQSGVMFQVEPMLKGGTGDSWYDADWFEPAPAKA
jgi:hypothetical protein